MKNPWILSALIAVASSPAHADLRVDCESCVSAGENRTAFLLMRKDKGDAVSLRWTSPVDPTERNKWLLTIYAGNPASADAIPDRGELDFRQEGSAWVARKSFPAASIAARGRHRFSPGNGDVLSGSARNGRGRGRRRFAGSIDGRCPSSLESPPRRPRFPPTSPRRRS
jgi:hypothetical protein